MAAVRTTLQLFLLLCMLAAPCLTYVPPVGTWTGVQRQGMGLRGNRFQGSTRPPTNGLIEAARRRTVKCQRHPRLRLSMQLDTENDDEEFVKNVPVDPLDQAELLMEADADGYEPLEGDILIFVADDGDAPKLGMAVEDSCDGEVKVKELSRREGDGEFDEWKCFTAASQTAVEVPIYNVRYVGSCTECIEEEES